MNRMIRRYHDFDPYTAVKPMIPGVFCKECGNREDNPNHRPPEPVIDWEARALAAEQALTEARAELAALREAVERVARTLAWMPSAYTVASENALRVVGLLQDDAREASGVLTRALAAPVEPNR